jgi:hypothetical protein
VFNRLAARLLALFGELLFALFGIDENVVRVAESLSVVRYKRQWSVVGAAQPKYQCLVACLIPWREHKNPLNLNGPPISRNQI